MPSNVQPWVLLPSLRKVHTADFPFLFFFKIMPKTTFKGPRFFGKAAIVQTTLILHFLLPVIYIIAQRHAGAPGTLSRWDGKMLFSQQTLITCWIPIQP